MTNIVAAAYAAWLLAVEILFYALYSASSDENATTLKISVLLGLVPAAGQLLLLGFNRFGSVASLRMVLVFLLIVLLGYLGNAQSNSLNWLASLVFVFGVGLLVASCPDERLIRSIAVIYSIPAALFLIYVSITGEHVWGRLAAHGITSDWWGLMGAALAVTGLAHRSLVLVALCVFAGLYITYDASARSDMLAILAGLIVVGAMHLRTLRGSRLVGTIALTVVGLALFMVFAPTVIDTVSRAIVDTMKFNDPDRGLNSGLTGRTSVWAEAFQIWMKSPFLGVGFHQHQMFTSDNYEAHEVYLAALADTGIFGLIWYLSFILGSLFAAFRLEDPRTRTTGVGTIVTYMAIGLFDARGFSSGNPASLYFVMCCFFSLRQASLRRAFRGAPAGYAAPGIAHDGASGWAHVFARVRGGGAGN